MTKFNVGDQIRILNGEKLAGNGNYSVTTGKEYEVISFHEKSELEVEHIKVAGNFSNSFTICDWEYKYIELVNSKPTKNQRITTLENEVAELKLIVHELRGKKATYTTTVLMGGVPVDISNAPELKAAPTPTPNQQRAAIIEKAKAFVKNIVGDYDTFNTTVGRYKDQCVRPIFHVNEKKRAITALIYGAFSKQLIFKGITKCNPNDVFNEHIGKAIALGRALGLDVSEFEQAVQPTEFAIGQIFEAKLTETHIEKIVDITGDKCYVERGGFYWTNRIQEDDFCIINDTNAKYEVSSNE